MMSSELLYVVVRLVATDRGAAPKAHLDGAALRDNTVGNT